MYTCVVVHDTNHRHYRSRVQSTRRTHRRSHGGRAAQPCALRTAASGGRPAASRTPEGGRARPSLSRLRQAVVEGIPGDQSGTQASNRENFCSG